MMIAVRVNANITPPTAARPPEFPSRRNRLSTLGDLCHPLKGQPDQLSDVPVADPVIRA